MFSSAGHFSEIICPLGHQCELPNCIFSHDGNTGQQVSGQLQVDTSAERAMATSRPRKRLRLSQARGESRITDVHPVKAPAPPTPPEEISDQDVDTNSRLIEHKVTPDRQAKSRPISPPPLKRDPKTLIQSNSDHATKSTVKKGQESLNPRMMANSPAAHSTRSVYLKKLYEILTRLNNLSDNCDDAVATKLSEEQLISLALDEEEKIALTNPTVYANVIKHRMVALSKMDFQQWRSLRLEIDLETDASRPNPQGPPHSERVIDTGLSVAEEIQILPHLLIDEHTLKRYGFIISPPTDREISDATEGVDAAMGWEQCERCRTRFQVFPERREDGSLTSGGSCKHHYGRIQFSEVNLSREKTYTCCNQPVGSSVGCVTSECHVFRIKDSKRLASIMQFEETPENSNAEPAVCLDCEMAYTVNGMEMIRLTAVSWPEGNDLLDVLVRPLGTVLDFNTRFSGVQAEDFIHAIPYGSSSTSLSEIKHLPVVDSPMEARQLLFELVSPTTPLIGHSLENDLNVTRVIHTSVVDSMILYPHKAGLPMRSALKKLTKDILSREIQTATSGHDSKEDAKAAGDLVRMSVATNWRRMRADGWTFREEVLRPPQDQLQLKRPRI